MRDILAPREEGHLAAIESDDLPTFLRALYANEAWAAELGSMLEESSRLGALIEGLRGEVQALGEKLSGATRDRDELRRLLEESTMKTAEANKRADGLQQATDHARADTIYVRGEIEAARKARAEQLERIRNKCGQELEKERARSERERQRYEDLMIRITAEAAHLRGKLEALEPPNVAALGQEGSLRKKEKTGAAVQQDSNQ